MREDREGDGEKLPHVTISMVIRCGSIRVLESTESMEVNMPSSASWMAHFSVGFCSGVKMNGGA